MEFIEDDTSKKERKNLQEKILIMLNLKKKMILKI